MNYKVLHLETLKIRLSLGKSRNEHELWSKKKLEKKKLIAIKREKSLSVANTSDWLTVAHSDPKKTFQTIKIIN